MIDDTPDWAARAFEIIEQEASAVGKFRIAKSKLVKIADCVFSATEIPFDERSRLATALRGALAAAKGETVELNPSYGSAATIAQACLRRGVNAIEFVVNVRDGDPRKEPEPVSADQMAAARLSAAEMDAGTLERTIG